ncbi:hypothetical protein Zmor_022102 [Zophobas morio]|uniref:Uncharacterized protein n=1 Tax=Zophobas morio TaxID=2755281 RepID=A0AA38HIV8_9CUCU|nr:hypothetical protein Zmor_022102 [Zophobas morio]
MFTEVRDSGMISEENMNGLKEKLGLSEEGVDFVAGDHTYESFGSLNTRDAAELNRLGTAEEITSLNIIATQLRQSNASVIKTLGEALGISPKVLTDTPE